jgi:Trk K+ transport system NAD-binding subunit
MKRNRFVIIGAGAIGHELLKKVSKDYEVLCIDINPEAETLIKKIRADVSVLIGDATSRLVLEKAGVNEADGVILTTSSEEVNMETARILTEHFQAKRIISVGISSAATDTLEDLGVEVENIFTAGATGIRNRLEHKSRAAHAIGLGKNEILEVEVHPNSRLANKPVRLLAPLRWRLGIIYRADNIIIPSGNSVLKPHDRVVVLGDPAVLKTVSDILTFNFQQFPLEYGSTMIAYLTGNENEQFFHEIDYLFSIFPLRKAVFLCSAKAAKRADDIEYLTTTDNLKNRSIEKTALKPLPAIQQKAAEINYDQGLVVVSKDALIDSPYLLFTNYNKKHFLYSLSRQVSCPVLISLGTFPYEKMLVPCGSGLKIQNALETSLEISASLNNEVTALAIKPLKYISSEEDLRQFEERKRTISEISLMYKMSITTETREGNPVKVVQDVYSDYSLMVIDTKGWRPRRFFSFLSPDIIWHTVKNSSISTLMIPPLAELL